MLKFRSIPIKNYKQYKYFDCFTKQNWGEHSEEGDTEIDFFSKPDFVNCLYDNKTKVSSLFLFIREISVLDCKYKIAGIGGVVTSLKHRHNGYALKLLSLTISNLNRDIELIMLCTEIETIGNLYRLVGFKPLNKSYYFIDKKGVKKEETGGMYLVLNSNINLQNFLAKGTLINVGKSNF